MNVTRLQRHRPTTWCNWCWRGTHQSRLEYVRIEHYKPSEAGHSHVDAALCPACSKRAQRIMAEHAKRVAQARENLRKAES